MKVDVPFTHAAFRITEPGRSEQGEQASQIGCVFHVAVELEELSAGKRHHIGETLLGLKQGQRVSFENGYTCQHITPGSGACRGCLHDLRRGELEHPEARLADMLDTSSAEATEEQWEEPINQPLSSPETEEESLERALEVFS